MSQFGSFFFINVSLITTSGNCTPGSRSYSDLVDTCADYVCIHQLVLKPVQSLPVQGLVPINAH